MTEAYTELEIRVGARREQSGDYPVEAALSDGSTFGGGRLRLDEVGLLQATYDAQAYGLLLFEALFKGPIRQAYERATGRAAAETADRLRLRLRLDPGASELGALPWERLYHLHRGQMVPLAAAARTPFSRYLALPIETHQPVSDLPVRLLFAVANPRDLPAGLSPVEVAREVAILREAVGDLVRTGRVQITLLPGRSGLPADLQATLETEGWQVIEGATDLDNMARHLPGQHILHFVGHGTFRAAGQGEEGTAYLYLERDDGEWQVVADNEIRTMIANSDPGPQLVFLAACESARTNEEASHPYIGLAPKLVQAGVPAVVAMQDIVPEVLVQQLTADFYQGLLTHGVVDRALNEARNLLFRGDDVDWAIPVLFMRLASGQLFTADPVRKTLQAMLHWEREEYLPMPVEVAHLAGPQERSSLERIEQEPTPSIDLLGATMNIFAPDGSEPVAPSVRQVRLIVLVGGHGTGKSVQLRHLARETARRSLAAGVEDRVIPVYVNLAQISAVRSGALNPLEALALDTLRGFWPDLEAASLAALPGRDRGLRLRFLFDGGDDLPERQRRQTWRAVQRLMQRYQGDEYLLAIDPADYEPRLFDQATDLLVVQPLSPRTIESFLRQPLNEPVGPRLFDALSKAQLFDLAAIPWLLRWMLQQADQGLYPQSRASVLENLIEEAIVEIPAEEGMRARARRTLFALAWEMTWNRRPSLNASEAFAIMSAERGNREYSLERLYDALVACGLMSRVGEEAIRFAYPPIQAYCCAGAILQMPVTERDAVLDDIAASLGRLSRLRWWEGTLVVMSGLMSNPKVLHQRLLYGARLNQEEETLLIVRCLLESDQQRIHPAVKNQVMSALMWQSDSANVHRTSQRHRAIQALGQLRLPETIPYLARIANQKVRIGWEGNLVYDYSSVRQAAAAALQGMMGQHAAKVEEIDQDLAKLLRLWEKGNVEALRERLHSADTGAAAIAGFALAALGTEPALESLREAVFKAGTSADTRWAVTEGLALLDPAWVTGEIIVPLIELKKAGWYGRLAYLIGKLRTQDPAALAFLDRCLTDFSRVSVKGKAIQTLGWLYDRSKKKLLEEIAQGLFEKNALIFKLGKASAQDLLYLRRKAIEALANIGDAETLAILRGDQMDWDLELRQAAYQTSEEIYWRQGQN